MLKVKLIDGSNRTVLVDDSALLGEILAVVCKKVQINNPDEYGLRIEGKGDSTCIRFPITVTDERASHWGHWKKIDSTLFRFPGAAI